MSKAPLIRKALFILISLGILCLCIQTCSDNNPADSDDNNTPTITIDTIPPAAIANLTIIGSVDSTCLLSWTAPGDDGNVGKASAYDIKYATDSNTVKLWTNAYTFINTLSPSQAGSVEQLLITGLRLDSIYTFGIKSIDDSGNISALSNLSSESTIEIPKVFLLSPINGQSVADLVDLSSVAADNKGITKVEFFVDTVLIGGDILPPYESQWNAGQESHGSIHQIFARATDTDNNIAGSSIIFCNIDTVIGYPQASTLLLPSNVSDTSLTLTWSKNIDNDFSRYILQADSIDGLPENWQNLATISSQGDTSFTIYLSQNWKFEYRIGVIDIFGHTSYSNIESIQAGIIVNDGAIYTEGKNVTLTLISENSDSVKISNFPDFHISSSYPFTSSREWTLLPGEGNKTVYALFWSNSGYISDTLSDNILPISINPTIEISNGAQYTSNRIVPLTLAANGVNMKMQISAIDSSFSGYNWESFSESYHCTLSAGQGLKTVYARFLNDFDVISPIIFDHIEPLPIEPSIVIDDNSEYALSRYSTITLSANGENLNMQISAGDSSFSGVDWESFQSERPCTLEVGEGVKTVYARYINDFEIVSSVVHDEIVPLPINPSILVNNGNPYVTKPEIDISLTAYGTALDMMVSINDSTFNGTNWEPFNPTINLPLPAEPGVKIIYTKVRNDFEIISAVVFDNIEPLPLNPSIVIQSDNIYISDTTIVLELYLPGYSEDDSVIYKLSEDSNFLSIPNWNVFNATDIFYLSYYSGVKNVYIQVKNLFNMFAYASDTIILDIDPPTAAYNYFPDSSHDGYFEFDAQNTIDNYTDINLVEICWQFLEDQPFTEWTTLKTTNYDFNYDHTGYHAVTLKAKDIIGNESVYQDSLLIYNNPPYNPQNPQPGDGASDILAPVTLLWSCNDPDGDVLRYRVFVDTIYPPEYTINSDYADTMLSLINLDFNTNYYWRVNAFDIYNDFNDDSPIWSFTTSMSFSRIAFASYRDDQWDIYMTNMSGTQEIRITNNQTSESKLEWSPTGDKIVYVEDESEIRIMDILDTSSVLIVETGEDPAWSPDGSKIAYGSPSGKIIIVNADGSNPIDIGNGWMPHWSPTGDKIAFFGYAVAGNPDIFVMNIDGSERTRLTTDPGFDLAPAWSPMGDKIAFHSNRTGNYEIYTINIDGTGAYNVTQNPAVDLFPAWSPDGNMIVFESDERNNNPQDIYIINVDGTNERRLTTWQYADKYPTWSR